MSSQYFDKVIRNDVIKNSILAPTSILFLKRRLSYLEIQSFLVQIVSILLFGFLLWLTFGHQTLFYFKIAIKAKLRTALAQIFRSKMGSVGWVFSILRYHKRHKISCFIVLQLRVLLQKFVVCIAIRTLCIV